MSLPRVVLDICLPLQFSHVRRRNQRSKKKKNPTTHTVDSKPRLKKPSEISLHIFSNCLISQLSSNHKPSIPTCAPGFSNALISSFPVITSLLPPQMAIMLRFTVAKPRFLTAQYSRPFIAVSSMPSSAPGVHSVQFGAGKLSFQRRLVVISPKASTDQPGQVQEDEVVDSNVLPYCSLDKKQKKSLGEMEQEFLQALQAFYYEGKAIMSNEEFDNLKEELMWEGSSVVMLSADEQRFLEASIAYASGNPIVSDEEFDKLKQKLKADGSEIVVEGPRCSLRSRKVYSDLSVDYLKMLLLNLPATVVALGLFFFLDDITGFEITYLLELPEPFSFLFTWFAAVPVIVWLSFSLTNVILKDFLILVGPCPNCGTENTSFFGTILSVSSGGATNKVKCSNTDCATDMVYDSKARLITLPD